MNAVMARSCRLPPEYTFKRNRGDDGSDCLDDDCDITADQSAMKSEKKRLDSFRLWPVWATQSPAVLAKAGFYYTGVDDRVECPFCYGILKKWHKDDDPLLEHLKHFPYCRFIQWDDVGNIPIVDGEHKTHVSPGNVHSTGLEADYTREEVRLNSFSRWPPNVPQKLETLARAGFYHIPCKEKPDRVKCAYCRGKLYNWASGDDPWIEHAKCFPTCPYIRLCIGEDVINDLLGQQHGLENTETAEVSNPSEAEVNSTSDEVTKLMYSGAVQAVLQMGFSPDLVRTALHKTYKGRICDLVSAQELVISVLEIADEGTRLTPNNVDDTGSTTANRRGKRHEVTKNNSACDWKQISGPPLWEMTETVHQVRTTRDRTAPTGGRHLCKVCMENQLRVTFIPCGHLACCGPCSMAMSDCPICRTPITSCVRSYF